MHIRNIELGDREEVSRLIFESLNQYYTSIGRGPLMSGDPVEAASIFFDVYEDLDPGLGWVAVDAGSILGVCFAHPRETHVSLGIMSVRADCFGKGIARRLLARVREDAAAQCKPVRLVSSLFNLDSYSLYTRGGFAPFQTFQDVLVAVPDSGLPAEPGLDALRARDATPDDIRAMSALEQSVSGISRVGDYRYFIENERAMWSVSVVESRDGSGLRGFLVSSGAPNFNMLGPGVALDDAASLALIHRELNRHPGRTPVVLVPVERQGIVAQLYRWGGRNIEFHVAQSDGMAPPLNGVCFPTFLPESG